MKNISFKFSWKNILFLVLVGTLGFNSCVKEKLTTETTTIISEPQELIRTSLYGRVLDENNIGIVGATVTYKSGEELDIVDTDDKGYFFFKNVRNKGKSAFVSVQHTEKFEAFRRMSIIPDRFNYTEIKMNNKTIIGQISAVQGGMLEHSSGAQITLPANGIIDAQGKVYSGNLEVAMTWIDPSAPDLPQRMVGDLSGIDEEGNNSSLSSFGMIQVELLDDLGGLLNLAQDATASLTFPVPSSMQSNAPATIPLWSYDEVNGIWIQEGEASFANGEYRGTVTHFSSWNVDFKSDPIEIAGSIAFEDPSNNNEIISANYAQVYVSSEIIGQRGGWLCEDGQFLFYNFPKNESFELKVVGKCGTTLHQETYGPYTENTDLGTIMVNSEEITIIEIKGNALDCDNTAVANGFVNIDFGDNNYFYPIGENGTFNYTLEGCADDEIGTFTVVDIDKQLISSPLSFDISQPTWDFENISVCDELDNFIQISINNAPYNLYTPVHFINNDSLSTIEYSNPNITQGIIGFSIHFAASQVVLNESIDSYAFIVEAENDNGEVLLSDLVVLSLVFTTFDNFSGGYLEGTFVGEKRTLNETLVPIEAFFKVPVE